MLKTIKTTFRISAQSQRMHALIKLPDNSERIVRVSAWAGCKTPGLPPPDPSVYLLRSDGGELETSSGIFLTL